MQEFTSNDKDYVVLAKQIEKNQPVKQKSESQASNDKQKSELNTDEPIKPETITVQT